MSASVCVCLCVYASVSTKLRCSARWSGLGGTNAHLPHKNNRKQSNYKLMKMALGKPGLQQRSIRNTCRAQKPKMTA